MRYRKSLEIEQRLSKALRLGVSIPTVFRYIQALRVRGHDIWAESQGTAWRYVLAGKTGLDINRGYASQTESRPMASGRDHRP